MSESYPHLTQPAKGATAFSRISEETSPSQAAILLLLGHQFRSDRPTRARARAVRAAQDLKRAGLDDDSEFPVPRLRGTPTTTGAFAVSARLRKTFAFSRGKTRRQPDVEHQYRDCAERLYRRERVDDAVDLLQMCLDHPRILVRAAAAAAYWPVTSNRARCAAVLKEAQARARDLGV